METRTHVQIKGTTEQEIFFEKDDIRVQLSDTSPPHIKKLGLFGYINNKCVIMGHTEFGMMVKYQHSDPKQSETMVLSMDEFCALLKKDYPQLQRETIEKALVNTEYARNMYNY